jgi:hypothetical protein
MSHSLFVLSRSVSSRACLASPLSVYVWLLSCASSGKAAKQVAERRRLIKQLYGVDPDDLLIDSDEYQHNTGSFAAPDPFRRNADRNTPRALSRSASAAVTLSSYSFSSFFSRLSFYYRSLVSALPIPAFLKGNSHAYASLALDTASASSASSLARSTSTSLHALSASMEDHPLSPQDADMQALLKNV